MVLSTSRAIALAVTLSLAASAAAQTDALTFTLAPIERIENSEIARSFGVLHNRGLDISNVTVQVDLLGPRTGYIGGQNDAHWTCRNGDNPYVLFCTTPLIRAGESLPLQIYAGPFREARFQLSGQASWQAWEATLYSPVSRQQGRFPREFIVSNTGDTGPGSLRAAIDATNAECTPRSVPCSIVFHIDAPVAEGGWYTIYPNTPLPAITSYDIEIDGATQTKFGGDTNPLGPEIALDGAAVGIGHGLELAHGVFVGDTIFANISNLAIGGFPWSGIAVKRDSSPGSKIEGNYIGTDPTGTRAHPNRSRGLTFDLPSSNYEVTRNVISGNGRSGVFIAGASGITLSENKIGAGTNGVAIPNGASGVFIGEQASDIVLRRNTIAHNTWFGVAVAQSVYRFSLFENSITRNGFIGIDRALDGFNGYEADDGDIFNAKIPPPRIVSAIYDPATNRTTISGTSYDDDGYSKWRFELYASIVNDGQAERYLGTVSPRNGTFTLEVPVNLEGQFITAISNRVQDRGWSGRYYWASEFSEPVEVH